MNCSNFPPPNSVVSLLLAVGKMCYAVQCVMKWACYSSRTRLARGVLSFLVVVSCYVEHYYKLYIHSLCRVPKVPKYTSVSGNVDEVSERPYGQDRAGQKSECTRKPRLE